MSNSPKLLKEEDASPIDDDEEFLTKNIRVLLVEADPNSLLVMNDLLTSLSYQVTSCNNGEEAISFLHKSKDEIDLVIWDYHMREVNVLQALNTIGKEMDLPVVITSHKHEKEIVTRSIMYGAYDFLVKPVSKEVMTVLWRHVFHKRMSKSGLDKPIDSYSVESDPDEEFGQSNEEEGSKNSAEHNTSDQKGTKKRMQWTPDLHAKFELAVKKIGNLENAVPKQILRCMQEEMNVEGLTRNNVASHLQKYRQGQVRQNALKNSSPLETQEDYRWSNGAHVALTASRPLPNFSMHHQSPPLNCSIQPPSNNYVTMNNMTNYYVTNTLPRVPYIDPFYTVQQQQHHHQPEHSYSSLQLPSGLLPPMDIHDLDDLIYDETLPCEPDSFPKGFNSFDGF